ncbi:hypothetical protein L1987_24497 [Smallanthus sonchifolius]|uniref:Uncharacterized protein n=1 Tax=Smallanthus sonchifolius TaxID=185202 RepID=A0ACB9IKJ8_9ASTR|nr:hypothetical protein L1987_24497 [Smallanthus sonchifolius]
MEDEQHLNDEERQQIHTKNEPNVQQEQLYPSAYKSLTNNFQILQSSTQQSPKNPPIIGPNYSGAKSSKRISLVEFASFRITNVNKFLSVYESLVCKDRCDGDLTVRNTSKKHILCS